MSISFHGAKRLLVLPSLFLFALAGMAQKDYYTEFASLVQKQDTAAMHHLLAEWERTGEASGDLYAAWANYYWAKAQESALQITTQKPNNGEALELQDSTGQAKGYITGTTIYHDSYLQGLLNKLDEGIGKYPNRLDLAFGKVHILLQTGCGEEAVKEIGKVLERTGKNKKQWSWTQDQPTPKEGEEFLWDCCQDYFSQIVDMGNDSLSMQFAEMLLAYYPTHIPFRTDKASLIAQKGNYEEALSQFLAIHKDAPDDLIVSYNIAYLYEQQGRKAEAVRYYILLKDSNDAEFQEIGRKAVQELTAKEKQGEN